MREMQFKACQLNHTGSGGRSVLLHILDMLMLSQKDMTCNLLPPLEKLYGAAINMPAHYSFLFKSEYNYKHTCI